MQITDERLGILERQGGEHSIMIGDLRRSLDQLERRVDRGFERVDEHLVALDRKIDRRTDVLDAKMARMFVWVVGLQITILAAMVGAFASLASLILGR